MARPGYLVLWAAASAVVGVAVLALEDVYRDIARSLFVDRELLMFCTWVFFNLACLALYVLLVWRGTVGARYANR